MNLSGPYFATGGIIYHTMRNFIHNFVLVNHLILVDLSSGFNPVRTSFLHNNAVHIKKSWLKGSPSTVLVRSVTTKSNDEDLLLDSRPENEGTRAPPSSFLIHWKGEDTEGYSINFRHVEFMGALIASRNASSRGSKKSIENNDNGDITFHDAMKYTGNEYMSPMKLLRYNQSMQYITTSSSIDNPMEHYIQAASRCSLVHALYEIVAYTDNRIGSSDSSNYERLADMALENKSFLNMERGQRDENRTWALRVRKFGNFQKERRYGERARSVTEEQEALQALRPLLIKFGGKVQLNEPDCNVCAFDGLKDNISVLARRIAKGPQITLINPNTRICLTNTPLCPIAAFSMCNVAAIRPHHNILDPFAGSCATLLAAAMIEPTCRSVGIEIASDVIVNRNDIRKDFRTRNLVEPLALIQGDCNHQDVRHQAREAIGGVPFDAIVADPPYGIRESTGTMSKRPIDELIEAIVEDRNAGTPLLRVGGRMVVFIPFRKPDDRLEDIVPTTEQLSEAGLRFELIREQPLNDYLSRFLVSLVCTH